MSFRGCFFYVIEKFASYVVGCHQKSEEFLLEVSLLSDTFFK